MDELEFLELACKVFNKPIREVTVKRDLYSVECNAYILEYIPSLDMLTLCDFVSNYIYAPKSQSDLLAIPV